MDWKSENIRARFFNTSRKIGVLSILMIIGGSIILISINIESWLGLKFFQIGFLLTGVIWMTPGVLIIFRLPWLAHAWLRGYNSFGYSHTAWEELSDGEKIDVYVNSLVLFFMVAAGIYSFINANIN